MGKKGTKFQNIALVAGLGNPDVPYKNTYHSVGALAVEFLLKKFRSDAKKTRRIKNLFEYASAGKIVLIKPLVFMNESGKAIVKALRFFDILPQHMIIMHDDSDLYVGDFKISIGVGSAGHKGIESLITHIGTKNFFRVRIGVRPTTENRARRKKASEFVLKNITNDNRKRFAEVFENIAVALENEGLLVQ